MYATTTSGGELTWVLGFHHPFWSFLIPVSCDKSFEGESSRINHFKSLKRKKKMKKHHAL